MDSFEKLSREAIEDGVEIVSYSFNSDNIKGLYCDDVVALSKNLSTTAEKTCVLAEELGHHYTSTGDILDQNKVSNRKQERRARLWAYDRQIGLLNLVNAFNYGCTSRYEIAKYLDVTETFLDDAIECYKQKYGVGTSISKYYIMFEPFFMIGKMDNHRF